MYKRQESYVAEFVIDTTVADTEGDDPLTGFYPGAILSSSITFSGGYVSQFDFSNGLVQVLPEYTTGSDGDSAVIVLSGLDVTQSFVAIFTLGETIETDSILADPAVELSGLPMSTVALIEPGGPIIFSNDANLDPMMLTISVPSTTGDINGDGVVDLLDVAPFVELLTSGEFQAEGDINGDGQIDLLDVQPFVDLLVG